MKKIFNSLLLFMVVLISSCSESFLDLSPEYALNGATYYQTEAHFDLATNGAYEALRGINDRQGYLMGEQRSDNTHYYFRENERGYMSAESEAITDFTDTPENNYTNSMYRNCYTGISRANTILTRIEGKSFAADFTRKTVGQAKFLRAYFYFQLVQYYGGVPLYLSEVSSPATAFLPRATVNEVYTQIIADVEDAIAKLDPVVIGSATGRATKGSAYMLYAKVLMTKPVRDYTKAELQLREIEKMGYGLVDDYADIYNTSKKNGKESIFEVQYQKGEQGQQSKWLYYFCPFTSVADAVTGVPQTNANSTEGGWNVPTQEMMDSYELGDKRKNVSIQAAIGTEKESSFIPKYVLNVGEVCTSCTPAENVTYYFVNKYRHAHEKQGNTDDNWPVYRYADVYLLLAECLVEQNKAGAEAYLTAVRTRAGLTAVPATKENIANERRHEFAFENQRWLDLVRTGKAIEVMTAHGIRQKALHPYLLPQTYKVDANKLLFPIPTRERQINTQLTQNPGYTL